MYTIAYCVIYTFTLLALINDLSPNKNPSESFIAL